MKKVLVLTTIVALAAIMSVPAGAAYLINWSDGFEAYNYGGLWGQGPWANAGGTSVVNQTVQNTQVLNGYRAVTQGVGVSQSKADLRYLNSTGVSYVNGFAKFWVYDPGNVGTVQTDGRVGLHSSTGADNIGKCFFAMMQANRDKNNWMAQWSYSYCGMDGIADPVTGAPAGPWVSGVTGTGWNFVQGQAAPRVYNAWSYVVLTWAYNYTSPDKSTGSATIKWFVNQMSVAPNLTLNINNATARWANTKDVSGVTLGALYTCTTPTSFDSVEFHANPIPEPSSLLALGTGLVGLMGLIRRRK